MGPMKVCSMACTVRSHKKNSYSTAAITIAIFGKHKKICYNLYQICCNLQQHVECRVWECLSCFSAGLLTLSWLRPLSFRNQFTDLLYKSMDWFLYDNGLQLKIVLKESPAYINFIVFRGGASLNHTLRYDLHLAIFFSTCGQICEERIPVTLNLARY